MKKSVLALSIAASALALGACNDESASDSAVVATSKAGDVTKDDLYQEMKESVGDQALQVLLIEKVLADKYEVTDKEVQAEFDKQKKEMGDSFEQTLQAQGQTEESFKKYLRLNILQEKALTDGVEVSDEDVKAYYDRMKTELNARHILVDDEETAKEVKKKLEDGGDFAALAKEYSTEQAAQQTGGDLGWFGPDKMVAEFTDAAYALDVNEISEPVKSQFGYHIIQVTEKREVEVDGTLDEKKDEIKKELQMKNADQASLLPKVSKMMKDADIEIKDEDLKGAIDQILSAGEQQEEPAPTEE
ncbi:peptidylprolyl isomerase [Paenisporosarcina cavernae]|uniref:Foldase protein PrsA n=1 Tax=Paenisporosarcina cavernae TaxID=2320858 RepID=A0A385YTG8_9BACL|nr:peptidylprolyl isomerase [Paenisporosarcina cavernae]AYC30175.1 foldase [Paenisporosarcina cavernae]